MKTTLRHLLTAHRSLLTAHRSLLTALALCSLLLALCSQPGCTSTPGQQNIAAQFAVKYAVLKVSENSPAKAAKIVAIAREVKAIAGQDGADTVDLLMAIIRSRVDFSKLDAADRLLADMLIETIGDQLKARLGYGRLDPAKLPAVAQIADWVIESATLPAK